jgi:phytoene dehydrogenase-like protein
VALGEVVDVLRDVGEIGRQLQCGELSIHDLAVEDPRCIRFMQWGMRPVTDLFRAHGLSAPASAVLLGEQGDYAVRPSRTPVVLQGGITDHYMRGAFYPEGGSQVIAGRLIEAIRAYGGEVRTSAPVSRVRVEQGRVTGVVLEKTGAIIDAPVVVSNADLKRTVTALVGAEHFRRETVDRVRDFRMSLPLFVVYLGLDVDLRAAGIPNTNYFVWGGYDIEGAYTKLEAGEVPDEDFAYVTAATLKDPDNPRLAPAGHSNVQIMTVVPHEYALWAAGDPRIEDDRAYHRDAEYRRRKAAFAERLIATAERVLPGIGAHVVWKEAATPLTQERFTRSTGGTSYGIELACDQIGPLRIGPETYVPGLYLCGASTPSGHGIANVMRSGVAAAGAALDRPLLAEIRAGEIVGDARRLPPTTDEWDAWNVSRCRV